MKTLSLTRGHKAIVDEADYVWLSKWKWHAHVHSRNGRVTAMRHCGGTRSKTVSMQEEIMGRRTGLTVDHIDGNPLNNMRSNLRWATRIEQSRNRNKPNKLGFKGVFVNGHKYAARISVGPKRIYLGAFPTVDQAATAYNQAAQIHFGDFARLNAT